MIYLDANATSRMRPEVEEVLIDLIAVNGPRNPSSVHQAGRSARSRLQNARKEILKFINLHADSRGQKLIFTSGGTEACNMMMLGFLGGVTRLRQNPGTVIISAIEHPAILEPAALLESCGWTVKRIAPAPNGIVKVSDYLAALDDNTALVALMAANNETGAVQPVPDLARGLRAVGYRGPIVSDFVQVLGKARLAAADLFEAGVNAISLSGHKLGAPAGIGALVICEAKNSACFTLEPLLLGGAQENSFRAGTENLLGALAFAEVCKLRFASFENDLLQKSLLRNLLWDELRQALPAVERLTPREEPAEIKALCNTLLVRFHGCRGDDLVVALDLEGVAASTGSACASGKQSISHVATAMGLEAEHAREVVRFSLDWDTTESDIKSAAAIIRKVVTKMRGKEYVPELAQAA